MAFGALAADSWMRARRLRKREEKEEETADDVLRIHELRSRSCRSPVARGCARALLVQSTRPMRRHQHCGSCARDREPVEQLENGPKPAHWPSSMSELPRHDRPVAAATRTIRRRAFQLRLRARHDRGRLYLVGPQQLAWRTRTLARYSPRTQRRSVDS